MDRNGNTGVRVDNETRQELKRMNRTLDEIKVYAGQCADILQELLDTMRPVAQAQAEWDRVQAAMGRKLAGISGDENMAQVGYDVAIGPITRDMPPSPQEGGILSATEAYDEVPRPMTKEQWEALQAETATPVANSTVDTYAGMSNDEVYKVIEQDWFSGKDGAYYIRGKGDDGADRRATNREQQAIDADRRKGRRTGGRRPVPVDDRG